MATANPSALRTVIAVCAGLGLATSSCVYRPVQLDGDAAGDSATDGETDGDTDGPPTDEAPVLDWEGAAWEQLAPTVHPEPTWYGSLAYDPARETVLLYGGGAAYGAARAELWELDGDVWTLLCDACPPGPRFGAAFYYDSDAGRLVLFGGSTAHAGEGALDDAWAFVDGAWTALATTGVAPQRFSFAHAYDAARGVLVVFGGQTTDGIPSDEVYELDGTAWGGPFTPVERPSAREYVMGAYAKSHGGVVVYGSAIYDDDAWLWNGTAWTRLCVECTGTGRALAAMIEAPPGGDLLLVGGWTGAVELAGTLRWEGDAFLVASPAPTARDTVGLAYDPKRQRIVLFGGNGDGCSGGGNCLETWAWSPPR